MNSIKILHSLGIAVCVALCIRLYATYTAENSSNHLVNFIGCVLERNGDKTTINNASDKMNDLRQDSTQYTVRSTEYVVHST